MAGRRNRRERKTQESIHLFDRHIVKTGTRLPDIYNDSIVPGLSDSDKTTEEQLVLYERRLTKTDIHVLANYIRTSHPYLTKLHINNNHIGVEGAEILANLISEPGNLMVELFLNRNYLYDQGVIALAEALKTNKRLKQLKVGYNLAKDDAAKVVAEMMIMNDTLRGLEFDGNKYTIKGLGDLADAMNKNKGLKVVQVGDAHNIKSRLQFVRMMIQTEDPKFQRTSAILCFSKDKNNEIIELLLEEWRVCKQEGKELINLPREKFEKFRRFNRLSEADFQELYDDVKAFLKEAREQGVENLRQAKIILMGRAGAGKTSLVRSLVAGRSLLTGEGPNRATASVEINKWTIDGAKCTFWDFGGQEEYYLTHTFFVTPRCVVLICVNLEEYENSIDSFRYHVQYFIDSIQSHAPGAKFIIVATHADTIPRAKQRDLKASLEAFFEQVEQENIDFLNQEIQKLGAPQLNTRSNNARNLEGSFETHGEVKTSHKTEAGQFDELEIGPPRRNKKLVSGNKSGRKVVNKKTLKNSSKLELFETPGMIVADDFEVEVEQDAPVKQSKPAKLGATRNQLLHTSGTSGLGQTGSAKERLLQERLEKLQKRRDNRPHLIQVCVTSSNVDVQGIKEFKEILQECLVYNHAELELSVQLPTNYASLYERITGDRIILTNPKIDGYNIQKTKSYGLRPTKRLRGKNRKTNLKPSKTLKPEMNKNFNLGNFFANDKNSHTPIVYVSKLYEAFVAGGGNSYKTSTIRKKKLKRKKLFSTGSDLHKALQSLHEIGYILWYQDNEVLRDIVFVDPHWVVNMIRTVIRHNMFETGDGSLNSIQRPDDLTAAEFNSMRDIFQSRAVLDSRLLFCFDIWKDASPIERFHMLSLMQSFDLLCEEARNTEKDPHPKYFIPAYLKTAFTQGRSLDVLRNMKELEAEVLNNVSTVPTFVRSLFFNQEAEVLPDEDANEEAKQFISNQVNIKSLENTSTFFERIALRPKNIQWRYEFSNFLPEGLFLRLLVRCYPFLSFYKQYRPTESFLVGKAALGVTIFIQVERNQYGLAGALVLTAIQEMVIESASFQYNMSDIWQVFSLFTFEIEELLNSFPGLESFVLVNIVHEGVGKVSIPRSQLESQELHYNSNPRKQYKNINVCVGPENVPMHFLIPPLFVLPRDPRVRPNVTFTTPELVRLSSIARIEYGLLSTEAQIGEEAAGKRSRVQILHKQLVKYVNILLKLLVKQVTATGKPLIMSFDDSLAYLKEQNLPKIDQMESKILSMREMEQSAFLYPNNRITVGHLRDSIRVSWDLFNILEEKATAVPERGRRRN